MDPSAFIQITLTQEQFFWLLSGLAVVTLSIPSTGVALGLWVWRVARKVQETIDKLSNTTMHTRGQYEEMREQVDDHEHRLYRLEQKAGIRS